MINTQTLKLLEKINQMYAPQIEFAQKTLKLWNISPLNTEYLHSIQHSEILKNALDIVNQFPESISTASAIPYPITMEYLLAQDNPKNPIMLDLEKMLFLEENPAPPPKRKIHISKELAVNLISIILALAALLQSHIQSKEQETVEANLHEETQQYLQYLPQIYDVLTTISEQMDSPTEQTASTYQQSLPEA